MYSWFIVDEMSELTPMLAELQLKICSKVSRVLEAIAKDDLDELARVEYIPCLMDVKVIYCSENTF